MVAGYLSDLRAPLTTNVETARGLLAGLLGSVILRRRGSQLLAEMEGQIDRLVVDALGGDNRGAGKGISSLPPWPPPSGGFAGLDDRGSVNTLIAKWPPSVTVSECQQPTVGPVVCIWPS